MKPCESVSLAGFAPMWSVYLIDLYSRRLLGYPTSVHPDADLAGQAVKMALATRGGAVAGVIFHSDRGSTYTANDFTMRLIHASA